MEWRGCSSVGFSALSWLVAPNDSRGTMPAIVPAAGEKLGVFPRRLRTEMPHKFPLFFHQRLLTKNSQGWLGKRNKINLIFSADRSCLEALNGFQNS